MNGPKLSILVLAICLTAADVFILVLDRPPPSERALGTARQFHSVTGGLGAGVALDLSACSEAFDPRLDTHCARDLWPIPGGLFTCPYHAATVLELLPLPEPPRTVDPLPHDQIR